MHLLLSHHAGYPQIARSMSWTNAIVHEAGDSSKSSSDNVIRPRFCHPCVKWLFGLTCQTLWQEFFVVRGFENVCPVSSVIDVVSCFAAFFPWGTHVVCVHHLPVHVVYIALVPESDVNCGQRRSCFF